MSQQIDDLVKQFIDENGDKIADMINKVTQRLDFFHDCAMMDFHEMYLAANGIKRKRPFDLLRRHFDGDAVYTE